MRTLGKEERRVSRDTRQEIEGEDEIIPTDDQAASSLLDIIGNTLDFDEDQATIEPTPEPAAPSSAGILLFSSSAKKLTQIEENVPKPQAKRPSANPMHAKMPKITKDLCGVFVFPSTNNTTKTAKWSTKWRLGQVVDPNAPLPHRSRYWPKSARQNMAAHNKPKFYQTKQVRPERNYANKHRRQEKDKPAPPKPMSETAKPTKQITKPKHKMMPKNLLL